MPPALMGHDVVGDRLPVSAMTFDEHRRPWLTFRRMRRGEHRVHGPSTFPHGCRQRHTNCGVRIVSVDEGSQILGSSHGRGICWFSWSPARRGTQWRCPRRGV